VEVFIDDGFLSEEATEKWKSRREKELLTSSRDIPLNAPNLLNNLFKENGVKVHTNIMEDNDDVIASYA
jgi:hypothetical protein